MIKFPPILGTLALTALLVGGLHSLEESTFSKSFSEVEAQKIYEASLTLTTKEDALKLVNDKNIQAGDPVFIVMDQGKHGVDVSNIINAGLLNSETKIDPIFLSKFLSPDKKEEEIIHRTVLAKYGIEFTNNYEENRKNFNEIKKKHEFNTNEILNEIAKKYPKNVVYVNQSFLSTMDDIHKYVKNKVYNPLLQESYIKIKDNIKRKNFDTIKTLANNPNLNIYKAAGNNAYAETGNLNFRDALHKYFLIIANDTMIQEKNYDAYNDVKKILLHSITTYEKFDKETILKIQNNIKERTGVFVLENVMKNIIELSISDHLVNYETVNMIEQLEYLKEIEGVDLTSRYNIVRGLTKDDILNNLNTLEKLNFDQEINKDVFNKGTFDKLFELITGPVTSVSYEDVTKLTELITNYPQLVNGNGSSSLMIDDSTSFKYALMGHRLYGSMIKGFIGTSAGTPQCLIYDYLTNHHSKSLSIESVENASKATIILENVNPTEIKTVYNLDKVTYAVARSNSEINIDLEEKPTHLQDIF